LAEKAGLQVPRSAPFLLPRGGLGFTGSLTNRKKGRIGTGGGLIAVRDKCGTEGSPSLYMKLRKGWGQMIMTGYPELKGEKLEKRKREVTLLGKKMTYSNPRKKSLQNLYRKKTAVIW